MGRFLKTQTGSALLILVGFKESSGWWPFWRLLPFVFLWLSLIWRGRKRRLTSLLTAHIQDPIPASPMRRGSSNMGFLTWLFFLEIGLFMPSRILGQRWCWRFAVWPFSLATEVISFKSHHLSEMLSAIKKKKKNFTNGENKTCQLNLALGAASDNR